MSSPYSSVSINGFNSNPPPDDGSQTSDNEITWSKHKTKLADPLKNAINSIDSNLQTAFGKIFLNAINSVSSSYTVQSSDQGKLISASGTITVTLLAAGTVGSNFALVIRNSGSGTVTVDGNGAETINGSPTVPLYPGAAMIIASNGSNWEGSFVHAEDRIVTPNATGGDKGADTANFKQYFRDGVEVFPGPVQFANQTASGRRISFTGIPDWATNIIIALDNVSTNGSTDIIQAQIADAGGTESTGYDSRAANITGDVTQASTTGFVMTVGANASISWEGFIHLVKRDLANNVWIGKSMLSDGSNNAGPHYGAGRKELSDTLTGVDIYLTGSTDDFDGGQIGGLYW